MTHAVPVNTPPAGGKRFAATFQIIVFAVSRPVILEIVFMFPLSYTGGCRKAIRIENGGCRFCASPIIFCGGFRYFAIFRMTERFYNCTRRGGHWPSACRNLQRCETERECKTELFHYHRSGYRNSDYFKCSSDGNRTRVQKRHFPVSPVGIPQ